MAQSPLLILGLLVACSAVGRAVPESNQIRQVEDGFNELESSILIAVGNSRRALSLARFAHRYVKRYADSEEIQRRFQVYSESLRMIQSHNKKGLSYTMAVNEFSDMTWDEFQKYRLGAAQNCLATTRGNHMLKDDDLPNLHNRSTRGSLWTSIWKGPEQQLVDCAGAFNNFGCNGGLPSQVFEYIEYIGGLETEYEYAYIGEDGVCKYSSKNAVVRVVDSVNITLGAEDELKHAVAFVRPVSMAFEVVDGFQSYSSGVYTTTTCGSTPMDVNHAVLAVGYGVENGVPYCSSRTHGELSGGDNGYFKMELGKNMCGVATCASYPVVA